MAPSDYDSQTPNRSLGLLRLAHEVLFSIYFALVIVSVNQFRPIAWWVRVESLYAVYLSDRYGVERAAHSNHSDLILTGFLMVCALAAVIFMILRLLGLFPRLQNAIWAFAGAVIIAGLPVLEWSRGVNRLPYLGAEVLIISACAVLYALGRWPVSAPLNIFLLVSHWSLWAWVTWGGYLPSWYLFWPVWKWHGLMRDRWHLVYPIFGLCCGIAWGLYVHRLSKQARLSGVVPV
jgi:hypothetical protein